MPMPGMPTSPYVTAMVYLVVCVAVLGAGGFLAVGLRRRFGFRASRRFLRKKSGRGQSSESKTRT